MDSKKFRQNLENTLGKRLDKISKDFISHKSELEKAKNMLYDLNRYIESKNRLYRSQSSITPSPSNPVIRLQKYSLGDYNRKPKEESKETRAETKKASEKSSSTPLIIAKPNPFQEEKILPKPYTVRTQEKLKARIVVIPKTNLDIINSQIKAMENQYSNGLLTAYNDFAISLGGKSAFDIIKAMAKENFKLSENPDVKILWAMGLLYKILGQDFDLNSNAKAKAQQMLCYLSESASASDLFVNLVKDFDFDNYNIDQVEEYIAEKEEFLAPQAYTQISQLCGLLMVPLREAVIYSGLIKGKSPVWRVYQRLLHKKNILESIQNKNKA